MDFSTPRPELYASVNSNNEGLLSVNVTSDTTNLPIDGAQVQITYNGEPDRILEETTTNSLGQIQPLSLSAPPVEYSMEPGANKPYAEYTISISAPGFEPFRISGAEVFSGETAIQNASLLPISPPISGDTELFVIPDHTLWGDYPPKIAEDEIKPIGEFGEIVLSRVVIPEYIVVHNGPPSDRSAKDYYVPYRDYIKNVASSEIYSTWPEATLEANILAIQSFTLNRVFTEWYRNKGYDFTITSSTAYDHKWIPNRNIFESISNVVDEIFSNYLSRPGVIQPILTQYCDGKNVTCPNWMSQWGSKALGDRGYTAIEILHNYYGSSLFINSTDVISGIPSSYPGYPLEVGSSGDKVRQMQAQLNVISDAYPLIPKLVEDGIFGPATENAVKTFQRIFNLTQDGIVGFRTWYKISEIYVAVSRIAEGVARS
ncbi:MAG: peptidoglycan-binding protein [Clostridiales bacterium]|nr:peptidoglycan-binding protein [Eubacterium sp.]MDD7349302.1 peptidoglycan-binding protein [Clostridiales bacterium]